MRSIAALALSISLLSVPSAARAADVTPEEAAARRDLISQAQTARASGEHARSLDLAVRAGSIEMSPSLRRFIAEEYAEVGDSARALGSADLCVREARAAGAAAHEVACQQLADRMRPKVGFVIVQAPVPAVPSLDVRVAGSDLPKALLSERYPVTPGEVSIDATAPGRRPFHETVHVDAGDVRVIAVDVPSEASTTSLSPPARAIAPALAPRPDTSHGRMSLLVPVGSTVAVVGLGAALIVWLSAKNHLSSYESQCVNQAAAADCQSQHDALVGTLHGDAIVIDVALAVGIVGAALGATGLLLPSSTGTRPERTVGISW